jgi:CYTH domain-containing protein
MASNDREIERKYLLHRLPANLANVPVAQIDQGYLPGSRIRERVRRMSEPGGSRYYRTIKMGSGIERFELEEETTELFFTTVWPLTRGRRVRKNRYTVGEAQVEWVIDEFVDRDLVLAEIELEEREQRVEVPAWLASVLVREVTDEPDFTNFALAR